MSSVPIYTQVAQERYREATTTVQFTVNPRTEPELYKKLTGLKGRSGYLKKLVYSDMGIEPEGIHAPEEFNRD